MDRLLPGEELVVGRQLDSPNGWVRLLMQADGNLVLYRTQVTRALWSSGTAGRAVGRALLRPDGNLVLCSPAGQPVWSSGTGDRAGASLVLQNDGNLVIYDATHQPRWASGTVQDFDTPTIGSQDRDGYHYVETSERWKQLCAVLPSFLALRWPGYATALVEDVIDGEPVVLQLWKGWCQKFLGIQEFPGGIGAEVGVYRRVPGRRPPTALPFLPPAAEAVLLQHLGELTGDDLWWPAPELSARLEFSLINPVTDRPLLTAGPENSYWLNRWMNESSYVMYALKQRGKVPILPDQYILEYRVNGTLRRWPAAPNPADALALRVGLSGGAP
jgi:hypothetical protein